jgi:hypothetical protein
MKLPWLEAEYSSEFNAQVQNVWSHNSTPHISSRRCLIKHRNNFILLQQSRFLETYTVSAIRNWDTIFELFKSRKGINKIGNVNLIHYFPRQGISLTFITTPPLNYTVHNSNFSYLVVSLLVS